MAGAHRDGFVYITLEATLIGLATAGCKVMWGLPQEPLRNILGDLGMGIVVGFAGGAVRYLYRRWQG